MFAQLSAIATRALMPQAQRLSSTVTKVLAPEAQKVLDTIKQFRTPTDVLHPGGGSRVTVQAPQDPKHKEELIKYLESERWNVVQSPKNTITVNM